MTVLEKQGLIIVPALIPMKYTAKRESCFCAVKYTTTMDWKKQS